MNKFTIYEIVFVMFVNTVGGKILNITQVAYDKEHTNTNVSMNTNKYTTKLKSEVAYTEKDLMMSLSLLMMLLILFIFAYFVARVFIYLAYHKINQSNMKVYENEEEFSASLDIQEIHSEKRFRV